MAIITHSTRRDSLAAAAFGSSAGNTETRIEWRHHRRAIASWPARVLSKDGSTRCLIVCDVAEGGVGLIGQANLPLGTSLDVALSVPDAKHPARTHAVRAHVRVMFSSFVGSQCRIGVQFIELPMAARLAIRSYVLSHS